MLLAGMRFHDPSKRPLGGYKNIGYKDALIFFSLAEFNLLLSSSRQLQVLLQFRQYLICNNKVRRTFIDYFEKIGPFPASFFFVFVFSIQLS